MSRPTLSRFAALGGTALILSSVLLTIGAAGVFAIDTGAKAPGATVAPNGWTAPANATANDGVYATARPANSGNLSQGYSTFNFGVPNGSIVDGITVAIEAKSSDSSGCQLDVRLSGDGGTTLRTKTINLTGVDTVSTLGGATDTWGQVWDPTQLTTANFRVQLRALDGGNGCNDGTNNQATTSVDFFTVLVTYRTMDQGTANPALSGVVCRAGDFDFVIDMSGSIGAQGSLPSNLQQLKDGIIGFVNAFQGDGGDGLYSGTRFSGSTATNITSGFKSSATFLTAVNALSGPSGLTPTATGITTAEANNAGDRAGVPNVLFVLTDGSPNKPNTHGDDLSIPETWLQGANGAVGAANGARTSGFVVEAVYLSTPQDPGDTSLPFSDAGNSAWATSVMDHIGGGSHFDSDFTSFVDDLFEAINCPPPPPAHLTIAKTANPVGPVAVGSPIGFDITIGNTGQGAATQVHVSDLLPAGNALDWSLSPAFPGCSISGSVGSQTLDCAFATLAAGATRGPIHLVSNTAKGECGTIANIAKVDATNTDPASNGASVVVNCPDISVAKTPDNGSVNAGANAVFTIVASNSGTTAATSVVVTDNLPTGYTWTAGGPDGSACSINTAPDPDVLTCNYASIAVGTSKTITLTAPTSGQNCAVIPNTASATALNEVAGSNNTDTGSINVLCANVGIVKTANPVGPVSAGADIGFDITVSNSGDGAATAVHVADTLPAGIAWTADATTGSASATCAIAAGALTCDAATMAAGTNFKVHIHGTTDAADCGTVSNTATASTGNDGGGSSTASVVVQCPDIKVTKTPDGGIVNAGDPITWTIKVENIGLGTAKGVVLTDPLPVGIAWTTADAGCSITTGTLTCTVGDLAAGASKTYTVSGPTSKSDCGAPIDNTATASATNEAQGDLGNDSDSGSVTVQCAEIHVTKTANPAGPVDAGDPIGFDIGVSNAGLGTAKNVTIHDDLPAAGGLDWSLSPAFSGCAITGAVGNQDLDCSFASLAPTTSNGPIHLVSKTTAADCGTVSNTASAGSGNDGGDQATASVVVQCPTISIHKSAIADSISGGELASFQIVVHNAGPGTAKDVTISDTLPGTIDWTVDDTAHCGIVTGVLSCTFDGLASGADVTVVVSGETTVADCGQLQNTATVVASNEPAGQPQVALDAADSHSSTATIDVNCATVVITKTADDLDIVNGDQIGYTIAIKNNGAGIAFGVTATDPLPAGFAWVISPASTGWSIDAGVLKFGPLPLAANGGTTSVHIQAPTTAEDCGIVENTASFSYAGGQGSDSSDVTVRCPSVGLDKTTTDADGEVEPGQHVTYGIKVSVTDGPVTEAVVTDSLPIGQTYVPASQSSTPVATSFSVSADGRTLTWTYDSLDSGSAAASIGYDVTIDAGASTAPQTNQAQVCVAEAVVDCASDEVQVIPQKPSITVVKTAGDAADGAVLSTEPGPVTYTYVVTNDGPLALSDIVVTDDNGTPGILGDDFEASCPKTTLAAAEAMTCTATVDVTVDTTNLATVHGLTVGGNPATAQDDAIVDVLHHDLTISKANNAPIQTLELPDGTTADLPTAHEGDTVTFTLHYTFSGDPVTNGTITDVLPAGLQYVVGSASSNAEFTFAGYNSTTRILSWTAAHVTASGTLTYGAMVIVGASELSQPLTNVATIASDQTPPDMASSDVFVPTIPAGETSKPTPPPTDTLAPTGPSNPGSSLMLILAVLGILILGIGVVTPVPAAVRRRNQR